MLNQLVQQFFSCLRFLFRASILALSYSTCTRSYERTLNIYKRMYNGGVHPGRGMGSCTALYYCMALAVNTDCIPLAWYIYIYLFIYIHKNIQIWNHYSTITCLVLSARQLKNQRIQLLAFAFHSVQIISFPSNCSHIEYYQYHIA